MCHWRTFVRATSDSLVVRVDQPDGVGEIYREAIAASRG